MTAIFAASLKISINRKIIVKYNKIVGMAFVLSKYGRLEIAYIHIQCCGNVFTHFAVKCCEASCKFGIFPLAEIRRQTTRSNVWCQSLILRCV